MGSIGRLPRRFPVGTRYVIESEPGNEGQLQVSARYLVMPNGARFDLTNEPFERTCPAARRAAWTSRLTPDSTKH